MWRKSSTFASDLNEKRMQIVNGEYSGDDCHQLSLLVSHAKGKLAVKFKVVFDFSTEHVECIKIYRAPRYLDLQALVERIIGKYDFTADDTTEFIPKTPSVEEMAEKLQLFYYFRSRSCLCA